MYSQHISDDGPVPTTLLSPIQKELNFDRGVRTRASRGV